MPKVLVPTHLRSYTKTPEVSVPGRTLGEVVGALDRAFPGIRFRIIDEQDQIRTHIKFFIGPDLAPDLAAPVRETDEIMIVAALSGG